MITLSSRLLNIYVYNIWIYIYIYTTLGERSFLPQWIVVNADSELLQVRKRTDPVCSAVIWMLYLETSPSGGLREQCRAQEQEDGRSVRKCWMGHGCCTHKHIATVVTCTRLNQPKIPAGSREGLLWLPSLTQGLLTGDDCGEGSHFSLEVATNGLPMPRWVTP